ncbi:cI repressor [Streptococcus pneumoniae]|nr:cI repressor [Streptococcus pneumoniae]
MKVENKEIFANNLSFYMEQKGVDRNTLCADLDLKYTTVRDWLKGITYPRIGKIELLANYFNINKSDLIENKIFTAQPSDSLLEKITNTARKLNTDNKKIVLRTSEELLESQEYVKKLRQGYLESLNPDYEDIHLDESNDIRTIGEVVSVYREK